MDAGQPEPGTGTGTAHETEREREREKWGRESVWERDMLLPHANKQTGRHTKSSTYVASASEAALSFTFAQICMVCVPVCVCVCAGVNRLASKVDTLICK